MEHKLYRSRDDRMIAGVCGGIGEFFDIDATLVRVALAALTVFTSGAPVVLYVILAIIIPQRPFDEQTYDLARDAEPTPEMKPVVDKLESIENQARRDLGE